MKTKPKQKKFGSLVPVDTLTRLIGKEPFAKLLKYIKKKWPKTKQVWIGYSEQGLVLHSNSHTGQRLGYLKDLMTIAKVQSKPEPEFTHKPTEHVETAKTKGRKHKLKIYPPVEDEGEATEKKLLKKGLLG
jgi:hypothetical protein